MRRLSRSRLVVLLTAGLALWVGADPVPAASALPPPEPAPASSVAPSEASPGASAEAPAAPRVRPFGSRTDAPHDPWDDDAEAANACRTALETANVGFRSLPDRARRDARGCGIPHAVIVTRGPTGIAYHGALLIDCSLARELGSIEQVLQDQAQTSFGEPITRITTLGSYSCRGKIGSSQRGLSEHALGNAMDFAVFHGKNRRVLASVALHYDPDERRKPTQARAFLHAIHQRLRQETRLTRVIGPDWNASHRDHFHLDRGLPWWWGDR